MEKRLAARVTHMEGVKRGKAEGWIIDGGALIGEEGRMCGSSMLLEFPDRAALDGYVATDNLSDDRGLGRSHHLAHAPGRLGRADEMTPVSRRRCGRQDAFPEAA